MMAMVDTLLWVTGVVLVVLVVDSIKKAVKGYKKSKSFVQGGLAKEDKLTKEIKELRLDIMDLSEEIIDTNDSIREDIAEAIFIIEEYKAEEKEKEQLEKEKDEYEEVVSRYVSVLTDLDIDFYKKAYWNPIPSAEQIVAEGKSLTEKTRYLESEINRLKGKVK